MRLADLLPSFADELVKISQVEYRGKTFPGYNQPIKSDQRDKKQMVLAKSGDKVRLIHFGHSGYKHNYSDEAKKNYLTRSAGIKDKDGNLTRNNKLSANYWARRVLWPKGEANGSMKTAAARLTPAKAKELVNAHHETQDWKRFEKNLNTKMFRQAVLLDPDSDAKLKRYTKTLGEYKSSKVVVGVVPSRTSSKLYKVKQLPNGRLGCSCKDWQYAHSHKKTSDCDHIRELRGGLQ